MGIEPMSEVWDGLVPLLSVDAMIVFLNSPSLHDRGECRSYRRIVGLGVECPRNGIRPSKKAHKVVAMPP